MTNFIEKIGEDLLKPFQYAAKVEKILASAIADEPELKTAITTLVSKVEGLIGDGSLDVAEKGLNLPDDVKTWADVQAFGAWFSASFVPVVLKLYGEVKTDLA